MPPGRRCAAARVRHTIPERRDQIACRAAEGSAGGRPPNFDPEIYKRRNVVERCFNRLKHWRDLATRYAQHLPRLPGPDRRSDLAEMIDRTCSRPVRSCATAGKPRSRITSASSGTAAYLATIPTTWRVTWRCESPGPERSD
jgi:hypothetical protein